MLVCVNILSHQIADGINLSIGSHKAGSGIIVFRIPSLHEIGHILVNQIVQRDHDPLSHTIFFIIQLAFSVGRQNDIRIFTGSKCQIQLCFPVGAFDYLPFRMDTGLLFQTLYAGHLVKIRKGIGIPDRYHHL